MINVQYISDSTGKTTGVYIPIDEWNILKDKYEGIDHEEIEIPKWQKDEVLKRLEDYKFNPGSVIDFEEAIDDIEKDL